MSFNGNNSLVTVENSASLGLTDGMTLSAWVYPTALKSNFTSVITKEMSGGLAYALHSDSPRPSANLQIRIANNNRWISAGSQLPVRTWTHLAATHDGSSQALFVNGVQVVRTSHSGNLAVSNNPLRIGGNTVMAGRTFEGVIDEVLIYNRALSISEINDVAKEPVSKISDQR
ncbi:hypothetical protein CKO25_20210 [Thiocapsa imhoffii]|uniref:LamG-like jellyroll fold domain-containing protein n=1 Tax=Thiocapsa imhoffii TaxID=382777 RepID=A0A9X0WLH2_9GAMM|nr:hypothetical protein [Thiocapsa imhoffii]